MSVKHRIIDEYGIVFTTIANDVCDENLLVSYKQLYENKRWKPGFHEIVDFRYANRLDGLTIKGIYSLALMVEHYTSGKCAGFKTAIIAPDVIPSGLSLIYQLFTEGTGEDVEIHGEIGEAIKWIGLDDDAIVSRLNECF